VVKWASDFELEEEGLGGGGGGYEVALGGGRVGT
jgi:hypothetical protein